MPYIRDCESHVLEIDGSRYSGSGTIVRQAVAFAALTGRDIHITNARARRRRAGLRRQHVRAVEAICELAGGTLTGCIENSRELVFQPGLPGRGQRYTWDIGSAGSTTMLTLAVLPVLAFADAPVDAELRGGIFQDFAPSYFHLEQVMLPLLARMGVDATLEMRRPGYIPLGGGILGLTVRPAAGPLRALVLDEPPRVSRLWGIALSSHLEERRVSHRMADAAQEALATSGQSAEIEARYDDAALQRGAALAVFADLTGGTRMGADRAGALHRSAESIGMYAAQHLLKDLQTGAVVDRHAADQLIPYAALASGESRFRIPEVTEHVLASAWLAQEFFGAGVRIEDDVVTVMGTGFLGKAAAAPQKPLAPDRARGPRP
jgi:RNA 3'-terminal phosphate cyclase (ATP)